MSTGLNRADPVHDFAGAPADVVGAASAAKPLARGFVAANPFAAEAAPTKPSSMADTKPSPMADAKPSSMADTKPSPMAGVAGAPAGANRLTASTQRSRGGDLRKGRASIPGQMYAVTTVTHERERLFDDPALARIVIQSIRGLSAHGLADTHAFVVMPDHLHWLLSLRAGTLATLMARMKGQSARKINLVLKRNQFPVWQPGFHDHALRADEDVRAAARYIVANPLRAGLVDSVGSYPWWDAEWV